MNEFIQKNYMLEKKRVFQWAFYLIIIAIIPLQYLSKVNAYLFLDGIFIVVCVLFGLGFKHFRIWHIVIVTAILSFLRNYMDEVGFFGFNIVLYFFHWITFFLLVTVIKLLTERYQNERKSILNLVLTLSKTIDARDHYTAFHSENVAKYALMIAEKMDFSPRECQSIFTGALLHDIGKIGVSELILNKPGRLTDEEFEIIKKHPKIGYDMLNHISKFKKAGLLDIILYHHERFDGKGYPYGLKGDQIPLAARIVTVADSFDAMTSRRIYRHEDLSMEQVVHELNRNSGTQFDPTILNVFLELIDDGSIQFNKPLPNAATAPTN